MNTATHDENHTYIRASWRDVPTSKRDAITSFRHWLQRDLGIRFDVEYWREERDVLEAAAQRVHSVFQRFLHPHRMPDAQTDDVPWAGQVMTKRGEVVRLNIDQNDNALLVTLAHEARHSWQLTHFESFVPNHLVKTVDVEGTRRLMEEDATTYAHDAVNRWKARSS